MAKYTAGSMYKKRYGRKSLTAARRYGVGLSYLRRTGRITMGNSQPVFTETYRSNITLLPNAGQVLTCTMDGLPQLSQYTALYQKYRVIKAQWLLLPTWTGGESQNPAIFNAASGPTVPPGLTSVGTTRVVYAINNSPGLTAPASEQVVLQDNGCKIKFLDKLIKINHKPVPGLEDQNGEEMSFRKSPFLNFIATNALHYGVSIFVNQPLSVGSTGGSGLTVSVYCKLTFQLSDPR